MSKKNTAAPAEQPLAPSVSSSVNNIIPHPTVQMEKIPLELKQRDSWVLWKLELRKEKLTKVPYTAAGKTASSTDAQTWTSFEAAFGTYQRSNGYYNGIGYVFSSDDAYTGVDLDHCIGEDGEIADNAKKIIETLNSYTERSQSRTGLHIIIKAAIPGDRNRTGNYEMYESGRFFCVTGDHVANTPDTIEPRQQEFNVVYKQIFAANKATKKAEAAVIFPGDTDDDLISTAVKAKNGAKFAALISGDWGDYSSQSEADMAFCNLLAFYTKDEMQIDRIFRRSGLMREKWDRDDYSSRTITEALSTVTEQYQKRSKRDSNVIPLPVKAGLGAGNEGKPKFGKTDLGNAQRLVHYFGDDLKYCYQFGSWYIWDGKRWGRDETGEIERKAKATVRNIYQEALEEDDDKRISLMKHGTKSESAQSLTNLIKLARSEEGVPITPNQMDGNDWLLNCKNGVIDLKTGKLLPHNRADLITNLIPTSYDSEADCPNWKMFLNRIMQDEQGNVRTELVDFLQKAVGYSLTGSIKEQAMFFLYGSGKNGKSTFINTIKDLLGDYGRQSGTETFMMKQQQSAANNDIARLKGARFVSAVESEEGKRLAESLIKQLTGGEPMTARFLHQEHFEFTPAFKIFFVTNHRPQIRGTDPAIWRRIRMIPFTVTITAAEDDKSLPEKLRDEMPGILRWAVEGCLKWQEHGLGAPEEVMNATQEYREEMDTLSHFIDEYCVIDSVAKVSSKDLYKAYQEWSEETGEYVHAKNKFIARLKDRLESNGIQIKDYRTNAMRGYEGIGLSSNPMYGDLVKSFVLKKAKTPLIAATVAAGKPFWEEGEI